MSQDKNELQARREDLLWRSRILQKYSIMSGIGLIFCLMGLKYAPNAKPALLILLAVIFAISLGLKLMFAFRSQREARAIAERLTSP